MSAGLGGASTHFAAFSKHNLKQKFKPKYALFLEKLKNRRSVGGSASNPEMLFLLNLCVNF